MKKQLYGAILCCIVLYIIQFLLIPAISFELANNGILFLNTIIITIIGVIFFTDKLRFWWLALFIYTIMILLYSPPAAYRIGLYSFSVFAGSPPAEYDPSVRWVTILLIAFVHFFLQLIICLVAKLVRYLRKRWLARKGKQA